MRVSCAGLTVNARLAVGLCLGVLVLAPATTAAKPLVPPTTQLDSVAAAGSGSYLSFVEINAHSGPSGENATGLGELILPGDHTLIGPVTCLSVTGNTAILNILSQASFGLSTITLTDNGVNGRDSIRVSTDIQ
jgi:hypothetical protein